MAPRPATETLRLLKTAMDAGDLAAAEALCRAALADDAANTDALRHLATIQAAQGRLDLALRTAQRACDLALDDPRAWSDLGRIQALAGTLEQAASSFSQSIQIDPRHADGWHNLGTALKRLGDRDGAFGALKNALLLDPKRADTYLNLGNLLIAANQFDDAVECFERAAEHDPKMAQARSRLAQELSMRGKVDRAESLFRQSLGLNPDQTQAWFGLGQTLEDLGQAEDALACYLKVIERQPGHGQAIGQYLALVRDEAEPQILATATAAMALPQVETAGARDDARALVGYGLAKYHDRRRQYSQAAAAGLAANTARRRRNGPLDREALTRRVDGIIATYTRDFFVQHRRLGLGSDQPVFIVGLPRSGTTLTEQLLSAHPLMHGAGELVELSRIAGQCVDTATPPWQSATRLDEMQSRERAQQYLRVLRDGAAADVLRISDKSPLNFFQLALVAVLFPNASVIHCRREPRDNALSIWMENFSSDQHYATDFDDLAFFTAQYRRLMAHWRQHLPLKMLELRYEDTVADLETQARRLLDFLGLPWDARCLDFHKSERAVQTPSRWQVREPIYKKSVERWRAYAAHLPQLELAFSRLDSGDTPGIDETTDSG